MPSGLSIQDVSTWEVLNMGAEPLGPLRIAFHFNYETDESKMKQVKTLGFNTVWVYTSAPFMGSTDSARTLAFLDRLEKNGLRAILQVDVTNIVAGGASTTQVQNWITAVEVHPACIGFTHYDEPCGQTVSPANQNTAYNNIKAVTNKNVFLVESDTSFSTLNSYYTNTAYDVYLVDLYPNSSSFNTKYTTADQIKALVLQWVSTVKNNPIIVPPKQIIPVLPLYSSGSGSPEPTLTQLTALIEGWKPFYDGSYAVFAHDVSNNPSSLSSTMDTSINLRKLATIIPALFDGKTDDATFVVPKGYTINPDVVSVSNGEYENTSHPKIGVVSGASPLVVTLQVKARPSGTLAATCTILQLQDGNATRTIAIDYSYDNTNWTNILPATTFGALPAGGTSQATGDLAVDAGYVYVRYTLTPLSGDQPQYVGFMQLSSVVL